jgi:hypothetical protein
MQDSKPTKNRRDFLALAATTTATAGLGATLGMAGTAAAATGPSTEFTRWLDTIPGTYRQVTDWPDMNNGMGLAFTMSFLMTAPVAYGVPGSDVGAVLVIRHDTIAVALADEAWAKYSLGEVFGIMDPDTNAPAVRNPYYLKPGALPFAEAALQRLMDGGVKVAACNLALTFRSSMVAAKMGLTHEEVKNDWLDAVYPGIQVVPSGTVACHGAVGRGCSYLLAG